MRPILLLILLCGSSLHGQITSRSSKDTLDKYAAVEDDSLAVRAYYFLSYQHWNGNLDSAMHYNLRDSLDNIERQKTVARLEAAFERERQDRAIRELRQRNERAAWQATRRRTQLGGLSAILILTAIFALITWRTARRQRRLAQEKGILLQELKHRTRNHLSILTGLLQLQLKEVKDQSAREAVLETQRRVQSIALLNRHLQGGQRDTRVAMQDYLQAIHGQGCPDQDTSPSPTGKPHSHTRSETIDQLPGSETTIGPRRDPVRRKRRGVLPPVHPHAPLHHRRDTQPVDRPVARPAVYAHSPVLSD